MDKENPRKLLDQELDQAEAQLKGFIDAQGMEVIALQAALDIANGDQEKINEIMKHSQREKIFFIAEKLKKVFERGMPFNRIWKIITWTKMDYEAEAQQKEMEIIDWELGAVKEPFINFLRELEVSQENKKRILDIVVNRKKGKLEVRTCGFAQGYVGLSTKQYLFELDPPSGASVADFAMKMLAIFEENGLKDRNQKIAEIYFKEEK